MRALHSAERSGKKLGRRAISLLLCLCMTIPMLFSLSDVFSMRALAAGTSGPTNGVTRQADPSTMDTYRSQLDFSVNTRVAGRLWSDKTVFAYGSDDIGNRADLWSGRTLTLSDVLDGVNGTVELNDDFLHVYSVLGSSQQLNTQTTIPLDLVMVLDVSGSMGNAYNQSADPNPSDRFDMGPSKIYQSVKAMNDAIDRLMRLNPKNRVGVVLFSSYSQVLMPLAHYAPIEGTRSDAVSTTTNNYIRITDNYHYSNQDSSSTVNSNADYYLYGFQALQPDGGYGYNNTINGTLRTGASLHNSGDGTGATGFVGSNTNIDSGMWRGLQMLLHSTDTTTIIDGKPYSVIPAFVFLGDGDPQIMMSTPTSGQWWNPDQGSSLNAGLFDDPPIVLNTVMRTSLMKSAVIKHYKAAAEDVDATNLDTVDLTFNTVGISLGQVGHTGYGTASATALLNPSSTSNGFNGTNSALRNARYVVREAYNTWINWSTTNNSQRLRSIITYSPPSSLPNYNQVFDQLPASGVVLNDVTVTKQDVIENVYYTDTFFDANTADEIGDAFQNIVDETIGSIFTPVSGTNDLGVGNAITYMDPVGKYMDVKDVKNLVLFGEMYNIVQTAVYDYQWNDAYIAAMQEAGKPGFTRGSTPLPQGWYRGDPTADADFVPQEDGLPSDCSSAEEAWSKDWVFRVSYQTAAQFVPTLNAINDPGDALAKERMTEYTFYRIDTTADGETVDRNKLHMNPAYGKDTDIPDGVVYDAVTQRHLNTPGVYALSDLRIWVEDSGDYNDTDVEGTLTDANFDEALWINIPANMLPLRKIAIDEDPDGALTYTTNLAVGSDGYAASFPLRVFYTVGVSNEVLDDSNRINIAGAIGPEYIEQNKVKNAAASTARNVPQGNLEFFSNWYNPLNRYGDYVTTNTDYSYGDPVTSFSPATSNRYYLFEKALPLYNTAYVLNGGEWRKVSIGEDLGEEEGGAKFDATTFGGNLIAQDLEPANTQDTPEARQQAIQDALAAKGVTANEGDIILLKTHRLTNVTKPEDETKDPFSSDDYFFLPIEYYELKSDGSATRTQYVITRKGSEFGSAYKAAGITNGDMLCWHDVSGKYTQDYPYLSFSETSDRSRGKNYIGAEIDPETGYYAGCDKSLHQYPEESPRDTLSDGEWVVCAKPGGLRVGNLAQNVQNKGGAYSTEAESEQIKAYIAERYHNDESATSLNWGYYAQNVTRTANNHYLPTISSTSNIERSDIKVNVYLGNNGRLYVMDTTLLVTKMVEAPDGMTVDPDEDFNFQVFINGVTGTQSAIVVQWDESAGSWQRQFHYIDLELDSQLFLQTSNGTKATVDADGCRLIADPSGNYTYAEECTGETAGKHNAGDSYDGEVYYVFIGRNRGTTDLGVADTAFRVYHNANMKDGFGGVSTDDVAVAGSRGEEGTFLAAKVWLVSEEAYLTQWVPETGERPDPTAESFNAETYGGKLYTNKDGEAKQFELLTINPNISETSELAIKTPYRTLSAYWTKEVEFGKNANENDGSGTVGKDLAVSDDQNDLYDPILPTGDRPDYFANLTNEEIAKHTAEFTLKHGQALLFGGIPSGTIYRVTEKLTEKQLQAGYALKAVSHKQQVGSVSTYRPGAQSIPVYTKKGATYGEYGGGMYPANYEDDTTEKGLFWAVNKNGNSVEDAGVAGVAKSEEPFAHTNAVLWESYATMDKDAPGDNHHQPSDVTDGSSVFWLWDESMGESRNTGMRHDVLDNPGCVSVDSVDKIAEGKCDVPQSDGTVRHYMFYEGTMVDRHYEGEGSGYIRNIGRYIVSPTVHFGVVDEKQSDAVTSAQDTKSNTQYTGVYSVFGNTGTYEESANFVNTVDPDLLVITKQLVDMNGSIIDVPPEREFTFTVSFTQPDDATVKPGNLYLWKGNMDLQSGGVEWADKTHTMPDAAPKQSEYQNYILPASGEGTDKYLEPLKANADGTYTVKLKAKQGAVIYGLIAGTQYTVVEKSVPKYPAVNPEAPHEGEGDWFTQTGEIDHNAETYLEMMPSDSPNRADYVNQVFNGTLTVEKRIDGDSGDTETKDFEFSVTLDPAEGADLTPEDLTVKKYAKDAAEGEQITVKWTQEEGASALSATFTLKHGEKVVIGGIPANTKYTVKETGRGGYNLQHVADNTSNDPDASGSYLELSNDSVSGTVTTEKVDIYLLFVNGKAVAPPFTGGIGASEIMFVGALLIGLSIVLFLFGRRRNRRVI